MVTQSAKPVYEPYETPYEAIEDVKFLVKLWLQRHLILYAERYKKKDNTYSDLYVGEDEVNAFLGGRLGVSAEKSEELASIREVESQYRAFLQARAEATVASGGSMPLEDFRAAFGLADDRLFDVVLALLVLEVEPDFGRAYSHAWCDFTQKEVALGFLLELVCQTAEERDALCHLFVTQNHPLFSLGAVKIAESQGDGRRSLMRRTTWLSERIVNWFCGTTDIPHSITGSGGGLRNVERSLDDVLLPDEVKDGVRRAFASLFRTGEDTRCVYLHSGPGTGKLSLCEVAASQLGRPLLVGDCAELAEEPALFYERLIRYFCEVRLHNAIPVLARADSLDLEQGEDASKQKKLRALQRSLRTYSGPLFMTGVKRIGELGDVISGLVEIGLPHPTPAFQAELWKRALPENARFIAGFTIDDVVQRYSLSGGGIEQVAATVMRSAPKGSNVAFSPNVVLPIIRDHLRHRLGSLAIPVARSSTWDDMIVSKRTKDSLTEIVSFVRNREKIVTDWGFGGKVAYGRGVAALFYGAPGTGKTMAAGCIGVDLGMEVFQIDLSKIVDKYIGETEKNLGRVFEEGSRAQAILLFDEADSLFSKRTQVKSSTDRYANLEVNFLLQMIESYEGISILTSNFPESIDDAFKRRIRFKVEFPFPKKDERVDLWKVMIPKKAPMGDDVDFELLAADYELSGAHIKNVVLRAASMAAQAGTVMDMDTFVKAANREYNEMGKIVREYGDS